MNCPACQATETTVETLTHHLSPETGEPTPDTYIVLCAGCGIGTRQCATVEEAREVWAQICRGGDLF